jgi:hypothetical protein
MRHLAFVLVAATLASACVRTRTDPVTGKTDVDVESPGKEGEDWSARLTGGSNFPSVSGTATAAVLEGESTLAITLDGATPGSSHPWFLHEGTCDDPGPIVGDRAAYSPLSTGEQGRGTSTVKLNVGLNEASTYAVMVHASASDMGTVVACGALAD